MVWIHWSVLSGEGGASKWSPGVCLRLDCSTVRCHDRRESASVREAEGPRSAASRDYNSVAPSCGVKRCSHSGGFLRTKLFFYFSDTVMKPEQTRETMSESGRGEAGLIQKNPRLATDGQITSSLMPHQYILTFTKGQHMWWRSRGRCGENRTVCANIAFLF